MVGLSVLQLQLSFMIALVAASLGEGLCMHQGVSPSMYIGCHLSNTACNSHGPSSSSYPTDIGDDQETVAKFKARSFPG